MKKDNAEKLLYALKIHHDSGGYIDDYLDTLLGTIYGSKKPCGLCEHSVWSWPKLTCANSNSEKYSERVDPVSDTCKMFESVVTAGKELR
jgi:hypothetical protein